jgi:hypothetical protein
MEHAAGRTSQKPLFRFDSTCWQPFLGFVSAECSHPLLPHRRLTHALLMGLGLVPHGWAFGRRVKNLRNPLPRHATSSIT